MLQEVGILGALVACVLVGLFFRDQLGSILSFFTANPFYTSATWGYLSWAVAFALLLVVAVKTNFSVGSVLLFVLFMTHALLGAVELGTDGWIQNITGNILTPAQGKILFVFTSLLMFSLRFCADFIEKNLKLSPIGLLLRLRVAGGDRSADGERDRDVRRCNGRARRVRYRQDVLLADHAGRGRRSFPAHWSGGDVDHGRHRHDVGRAPRRPRTGLRQGPLHRRAPPATSPAIYEQYKAPTPSRFLFLEEVHGLDGTKLSEAQTAAAKTPSRRWSADASIVGDRETLKADAYIPAVMALVYLLLFFYFKTIGGYKTVQIESVRTAPATGR